MKTPRFYLRTVGVATIVVAASIVAVRLAAATWESASFHAVVTGTSTLHDWSVETTQAQGDYRVTASAGTLTIPAKSLSGGPKGLDERMHAALKTDTFPTITFEALELAPAVGSLEPGQTVSASARGRLTIAGQTRELSVPVKITAWSTERLVLEADVPLKLTDFGIKPPTFMGMIRAGDAIAVRVRWELRLADAAKEISPRVSDE